MRWPWHRDDSGHAEADQALKQTRRKAEESRQADAAGSRLADRIREMRQHNHLAEAIARALKEGR